MIDKKRQKRVLSFLAKGAANVRAGASNGRILLDAGDRGVIGEEAEVVSSMAKEELLAIKGGVACLTDVGKKAVRRLEMPGDAAHAAQHQEREFVTRVTKLGTERVIRNEGESPLALLWRRRDRSGRRFLDEREYRAGERLRMDYTYGQIMPRLGINWSSLGGAVGKSGRGANGSEDLSTSALAARQRVELALSEVGPEFSGILVDVCCFLKGLETVERERNWPVRSAKVMLKSALSALARHYEPEARARDAGGQILHWGTTDYRPSVSR